MNAPCVKQTLFFPVGCVIFLLGCVPGPVKFIERTPGPAPVAPQVVQAEKTSIVFPEIVGEKPSRYATLNDPYGLFRKRREIPTNMNKYQGSLWKGDSSFGNFMRDNRAQNPGDLLKITNIQTMVTQFEEPITLENDSTDDNVVDVFKIGEAERLKVHKGIGEMTVKVAAVSKSGLMAVYGEKVEFKDSNNTRYRTQLTGYIRPEDVTESNTISADKIQSFKFKTHRKVKITGQLKNKIIENIRKLSTLEGTVGDEQKNASKPSAENNATQENLVESEAESDTENLPAENPETVN